jgi:ankyrin repeat protein
MRTQAEYFAEFEKSELGSEEFFQAHFIEAQQIFNCQGTWVEAEEVIAGEYQQYQKRKAEARSGNTPPPTIAGPSEAELEELIKDRKFEELYSLLIADQVPPTRLREVFSLDRMALRLDRVNTAYALIEDGRRPYVQTFLDYIAFQVGSLDLAIKLFQKARDQFNPFEFEARMMLLHDGPVAAPGDVLKQVTEKLWQKSDKAMTLARLYAAFPGFYKRDKDAAALEIDTHATSIHASVGISAIRLFKRYLWRHSSITQAFTQRAKGQIEFTPSREFDESVNAKIAALKQYLEKNSHTPATSAALRMINDVIEHNCFGNYFSFAADGKVNNGLRIKDVLAICYDALFDEENLVSTEQEDRKEMVQNFVMFLEQIRCEYGQDKNKCAGGTVNHLVYSLHGSNKLVDVAIILPATRKAEGERQLNQLALADYQKDPRPEGLEAELKTWQETGKAPEGLVNRYHSTVVDKFKELYDRYFGEEINYLNDLYTLLLTAQIDIKLEDALNSNRNIAGIDVNEFARQIKDKRLPLFQKVNNAYVPTLIKLQRDNPEVFRSLSTIMQTQDWDMFLLYISPDRVALNEAIKGREKESMAFLTQYNIDNNYVTEWLTNNSSTLETAYKNTILAAAVKGSNGQICSLALELNASPYIDAYDTYLHQAAEAGNLTIVNTLLTRLPIAVVNEKDSYGNIALHFAALNGHTDIVNALLAKEGIKINEKNSIGSTALREAAGNGHTDVVNALLAKEGIKINEKDDYGDTALHEAAANGRTDIVNALLAKEGVLINEENRYGQTALQLAAGNGYIEIVNIINAANQCREEAARRTNMLPAEEATAAELQADNMWVVDRAPDIATSAIAINNQASGAVAGPNLDTDANDVGLALNAIGSRHKINKALTSIAVVSAITTTALTVAFVAVSALGGGIMSPAVIGIGACLVVSALLLIGASVMCALQNKLPTSQQPVPLAY